MADWNPNAPDTLGLEWFPYLQGRRTLDSALDAYAFSFACTTAETIDAAGMVIESVPTRGGVYVLEAYDEEAMVPANVTLADARPNEDVAIGGWRTLAGGTTNLWQGIDESVMNPNDLIELPVGNGFPTSYIGRFNTAAFVSLTGKRILSVELVMYVTGGPGTYLEAGLRVDGQDFMGPKAHGTFPAKTISYAWRYNPATRSPWTIQDILDFDSTDAWLIAGITTNPWGVIRVYQVFLRVRYCDENRLALGVFDDHLTGAVPLVAGAINSVNFLTPTGGNWSKPGTGKVTYLLRRLSDTGAIVTPFLQSHVAPAVGNGFQPTLHPTLGYVTAENDPEPHLMSVRLRRTDLAYSVDSQPYCQLFAAHVFTGCDAEQEVTGTADDYGLLRFLVRAQGLAVDPLFGTAVLSIQVKRRSDNFQSGSTYTLQDFDLAYHPEVGDGWHLVQVQLVFPATLDATQWYIEFSSLASGAGTDFWEVRAVDTAAATANNATFDGTTNRATVHLVEDDRFDLAATLATSPDPVALTGDLGSVGTGTVCCATDLHYGQLAWDPSTLAGNFLRYEVERSEDGEQTWQLIYRVLTEAVTGVIDWEALRGVEVRYRIRPVRTDLAVGDWSNVVSVTKPIEDAATHYLSNYRPDLNLPLDRDSVIQYTDHDAEVMVHHAVYGRDRQRAYQPAEVLGSSARWQAIVGIDGFGPGGGRALEAFRLLRDVAKAHVPYIAVLDHDGTRLMASIRVPDKVYENPFGHYVADVIATEIEVDPYVVDIV